MDEGELRSGGALLRSNGPKAVLELKADGGCLTAEGNGIVEGEVNGKPFRFEVSGNSFIPLGL